MHHAAVVVCDLKRVHLRNWLLFKIIQQTGNNIALHNSNVSISVGPALLVPETNSVPYLVLNNISLKLNKFDENEFICSFFLNK